MDRPVLIESKAMNADQVAQMLGVTRSFVYGHTSGGKHPIIPHYKFGAALRFNRSSILEWMKQLERKATA
jgi:excisionase family DNA binding protein